MTLNNLLIPQEAYKLRDKCIYNNLVGFVEMDFGQINVLKVQEM